MRNHSRGARPSIDVIRYLAGGIRQASDGVYVETIRNVRLRFDFRKVSSMDFEKSASDIKPGAGRTLRVGVIGAGVMGSNPCRRSNRLSIVLVCVI